VTGLWVGLSIRKNWHEIYHVLESWFPRFGGGTANPVKIVHLINIPTRPCWPLDGSLKNLGLLFPSLSMVR